MRPICRAIVLIAALLLLHPSVAFGATCRATIFFGNGIYSDPDWGLRALTEAVQGALEAQGSDLPSECFVVSQATERTIDLWRNDLLESGNQWSAGEFQHFWEELYGAGTISSAFERAFKELLFTEPFNKDTEHDLAVQIGGYESVLQDPSGMVIVVAHSQGNFFVNEAFHRMTTGSSPIDSTQFNVIAVATPASMTVKNSPHVTLYWDVILSVPSRLNANTESDATLCHSDPELIADLGFSAARQLPGPGAMNCHSFDDSYLKGTYSKKDIVDTVQALLQPVSGSPTARFSMTDGSQVVLNVDPLVSFTDRNTGTDRISLSDVSTDPNGDADIVVRHWIVDGGASTFDGKGPFTVELLPGNHAISLVVEDQAHARSSASGSVQVSDPPNTARTDAYVITQGSTLTVPAPGVLANDSPLSARFNSVMTFFSNPPAGVFEDLSGGAAGASSGGFRYTPTPGFVGTVSFNYSFTTNTGSSNVATVTIDVTRATSSAVDLGTLGGSTSEAHAINGNGLVVGDSRATADTATHAFVWTQSGDMIDIGTLGGPNSSATAVNGAGLVIGNSDMLNGDTHAFVWTQSGGMTDLGTLGGSVSVPTALNENGWIVGFSSTSSGRSHAFLWTSETGMTDLGILGAVDSFDFSRASAVSNNGVVVGSSSFTVDGRFTTHAFIWTSAEGMVDLGTLSKNGEIVDAAARDVNERGEVVGYSRTRSGCPGGCIRAFRWTRSDGMIDLGALQSSISARYPDGLSSAYAVSQNGLIIGNSHDGDTPPLQGYDDGFVWTQADGPIDLGTLGGTHSFVAAVNGSGMAVGLSSTADNATAHAIMWTQATGMIDLGTLGGTFSSASSINDNGMIAGSAYLPNDVSSHATVWTFR